MDRESVKDVLSRQRAQDFGSMDRPICQEDVKVKPRNLDRRGICREAIEDVEKRFFKGEKHIRWKATRWLLKQASKQHVKQSNHTSTLDAKHS